MKPREQNLRTALTEAGGHLTPGDAVAVIEGLAAAFTDARRVGVLPEAITPSSIVVSAAPTGGVHGVRFGDPDASGTAPYLAPERWSGFADERSDVYTLTAVLYECLTGHPPFPVTAGPADLLVAPPPRPTIANPAVPAAFDAIIARGLAKEPNQRYGTVAELVADCRATLGGIPIPTPPVPPQPVSAIPPVTGGYPAPPYPGAQWAPAPGWPPAPPRPGNRRVVPTVVTLLMVLAVLGYGFFGFLTKAEWLGGDPRPGVRATVDAVAPGGTVPSSQALGRTRDIVIERFDALGTTGTDVVVEDTGLTITAPGTEASVRAVTRPDQLRIRPVLRAFPVSQMPGALSPGGAPAPRPSGPAQRQIGFEKQLRQNANQNLLTLLAMPYVAGRCGQDDPLAGHDDPDLPLVTCGDNGQTVYVLDKTLVSGDDVMEATSGLDRGSGQHVVDVQFAPNAAQVWANFTEGNVGGQAAFTLDTEVVSAPQIREQIPGGQTQITGNFTADQARELAAALQVQSLPLVLTVTSSTPETVPGHPPARPFQMLMLGLGTVVVLFVIGGCTYLGMRRYRAAPVPVPYGVPGVVPPGPPYPPAQP